MYVPAVCEGASCGGDVSAKGNTPSYEYLIGRVRRPLNLVAARVPGAPPYFARIAAAAIMEHKLFRPKKIKHDDGSVTIEHVLLVRHNGRLLRHIGFRCWFGQKYPYRWDQPASCYVDVRINGKATNSADLTWPQAAARADDAFDFLSTRPKPSPRRLTAEDCPRCFYETPVLGFFWLWLNAAIDAEGPPRRYIPRNIYWHHSQGAVKRKFGYAFGLSVARTVSLKELSRSPRLERHYKECFRHAAKAVERPRAITERDKTIAKHWPLARKKCRIVPQAHRADAMQACMERLVKVYEAWKPELGTFGTFAAPAIDCAVQDFMREVRRQVPVLRSINVNDPAPDNDDDGDDDTPPEQPDMMKLDSLGTQAAEAKRRLVAERLDCLNWRERRVIEGTLGMNGYKHPVGDEELAAELGLSDRTIRRIREAAAGKLRQDIFPTDVRNPAPDRIYR
jgi:RNA polymerase sigma factor (sigma-70 family)